METIKMIGAFLVLFGNPLLFLFLMACGVKFKWYIRVIIALDTLGASEIVLLAAKYHYVIKDFLFGQHRD